MERGLDTLSSDVRGTLGSEPTTKLRGDLVLGDVRDQHSDCVLSTKRCFLVRWVNDQICDEALDPIEPH